MVLSSLIDYKLKKRQIRDAVATLNMKRSECKRVERVINETH
jgi:hypothetical protein